MIRNFSDLILLIGTSPLPNYVVIKYFIKNNPDLKRVWLIHTEKNNIQEGTKDFAENIQNIILRQEPSRKLEFNYVSLVNASSAFDIKHDLENKFFSKIINGATFHLNYTGGTKSMAVHVYRNIEKQLENNCTYSYLDARTHKLMDDNSQDPLSKDLRDIINISLDDLIGLHNYQKLPKDDNKKNAFNPCNLNELIDIFEGFINENILKEYLDWRDNVIRKFYYDGDDFLDNKNKFYKKNKIIKDNGEFDEKGINELKECFNNKTNDEIKSLLMKFPENLSILDENGNMWIPDKNISSRVFKNRLSGTIKEFLDGKWLEIYVKRNIENMLQKEESLSDKYHSNMISVYSNWEIRKNNKPFELDVILINGYQVCGISCTTSKYESLCKEKGFEIIHRVKQIGGDEAKAILITCLDDSKINEFEEDIRNITGNIKSDFIALSISDLKSPELWRKIKEQIWESD